MEKRMSVTLGGKEYTLVYEDDTEYMEKLANFVNRKILEQRRSYGGSELDSTIMAALTIADDYLKTQAEAEHAKEQIQICMEDMNKAKQEAAELRRELKKYKK